MGLRQGSGRQITDQAQRGHGRQQAGGRIDEVEREPGLHSYLVESGPNDDDRRCDCSRPDGIILNLSVPDVISDLIQIRQIAGPDRVLSFQKRRHGPCHFEGKA